MSQLIYNLQVVEIKELCIKKVERINFGYVRVIRREELIELREQCLKMHT